MQLTRVSGILIAIASLLVPTSVANHADGTYEIPVWFEWDRSDLQVLIVPPEHGQLFNSNGVLNNLDPNEANPCTTSLLAAIRDSIQGWRDAVTEFGAAWLQADLVITDHVLGCDSPTQVPTSPDIVVYTDETKGPILGFAVSTDPCIVNNSKFSTGSLRSFNYADMFNVMGQEFGHCLGLQHTGDPDGGAIGDPGHPAHDVMEGRYEHSVGAAGTHRHCVSNLNVKGLEAVFDGNADPNEIVEMAVADYLTSGSALCDNQHVTGPNN